MPAFDDIGEPVYEDDAELDLSHGTADSTHTPDPDRPVARLYLPSMEHASGYRDYYIYPTQPAAPPRRPLGFRPCAAPTNTTLI